MKIIKNCWESLVVSECQYGAHIFDGVNAKIYVNNWLVMCRDEFNRCFYRRNSEGFVGHCLLVFLDVKKFDFIVTPYTDEGEKTIWHDPINFIYTGPTKEKVSRYEMEGSLHGFYSSVSIVVEAREFELHILEKDEPAWQS